MTTKVPVCADVCLLSSFLQYPVICGHGNLEFFRLFTELLAKRAQQSLRIESVAQIPSLNIANEMREVVLTAASLALTGAVVANAYYQKHQFYPSVVYLTKSSPSMAVSF